MECVRPQAGGKVPSCQAPVGSCSDFSFSISFLLRTEENKGKQKVQKQKSREKRWWDQRVPFGQLAPAQGMSPDLP